MNEQLMTLSKIFTDRLFRIPDYQRGYAWTRKEVEDFWNDLIQLGENKNHYVGVLTLEPVNESIYSQWIDDTWIINSKKYKPYYVVDGQQRLTTSILLIKAILDAMKAKNIKKLNYTDFPDIERRFISESKDENKSQTYLFSYDYDNPSYDYLINQIYENKIDIHQDQETTYTSNLKNALNYFIDKLEPFDENELEVIYRKITQHFLFNTYEISSDIDVFVTFETMNNRGKLLSQLELLKNRLIYLSTLYDVDSDAKARLRRNINTCWKDIYHILGQDKNDYLPDDEFLDAHFHLYFSQMISSDFSHYRKRFIMYDNYTESQNSYLLNDYFISSKVFDNSLKTEDIFDYISSLDSCVKNWLVINKPEKSNYTPETIEYFKKIHYLLYATYRRNRIYYPSPERNIYKILLLACLQTNPDENNLYKLLKALERFLFFKSFIPYECSIDISSSELDSMDLLGIINKLQKGELSLDQLIEKFEKMYTKYTTNEKLTEKIINYYEKNGFYNSSFLKYFLCEYELHIQKISKSQFSKLNRDIYFDAGYNSIEHIYPQNAKSEYWSNLYRRFSSKERSALRGSLGNFVAISQQKNSKLANLPFPLKKAGNKNRVAYKYGTYAEIELCEYDSWGPDEILDRGLKMVNFLHDRWGYKVSDNKEGKIKFLGLSFITNQ